MNGERFAFIQVVLTLGLGSILVVSLMYVAIPLIPILGTEFQTTSSQTVWAGSVYGLAYAAGNLIFGIFSDRFRRRSILGIGLIALTLSTFAVGLSQSLSWLIILRAFQGLIAASVPTVALAYIGDVLAARYRPLAISILSSGFLLSGILGQLYAQAIGNWLGWREVFLFLALGYLLISFYIFRLPRGAAPNAELTLLQVVQQTLKVVAVPSLFLSYLVAASIFFSFVTMYSGLGAYVLERFQMGEEGLMWIRIAGIPGILMAFFAGPLVNRFTPKPVLIAGLIIAGAGLLIEIFAGSLGGMIIASIVFVSGISIANPSIIVIISQLGGKSRGSAVAINAFFAFFGASLGALLAEYIRSFSLLCSILIILLLLAIIVSRIFIRTGQPLYQEENVSICAEKKEFS